MTQAREITVKVQVPLASSENAPPALVYDQDRAFHAYIPMTPALGRMLGGDPKGYFRARVEGKTLELLERLPAQPW